MKVIKSCLFSVSLIAALSGAAYAESGTCSGKASDGKKVVIHYFTNGYSDDSVDFYAKIQLGSKSGATYALSVDTGDVLRGDATQKSRNAGLDFGAAVLNRTHGGASMSGSLGQVDFSDLSCTHEE